MSFSAALLLVFAAQAQPLPEPGRRIEPPAKVEKTEPAAPKKQRPRVTVKPKGGTGSAIGDDKPGGGPPTAESSKGGTPGTPSGSFTGPPPRP
jgi:hypothetical protein